MLPLRRHSSMEAADVAHITLDIFLAFAADYTFTPGLILISAVCRSFIDAAHDKPREELRGWLAASAIYFFPIFSA